MTDSLLASFGLFGGALVLAIIAGMVPIVSFEVFLGAYSAVQGPSTQTLLLLVAIGATGHQIAKTVCYFMGEGLLDRTEGRWGAIMVKARARVDRWNKRPWIVMLLASTVGFPPMFLLAFVAGPLMRIRFWPFTAISLGGRLGRYSVVAFAPRLF